MTRNGMLIIALFGLAACGSNPVEDHYYSLVLAADDVQASSEAETSARLIVGPVQLPEFLNRRGMAMQVGSNQVQTANHHFWAEPLEEAIAKVLVRDIANLAQGLAVDRDAGRWTDTGDCRLRIEFDKFHATDRARVVNSGRYWISSPDSSVKQEFDLSERLPAGGYANAVSALRRSLGTLAAQIAGTIESNPQCIREGAT